MIPLDVFLCELLFKHECHTVDDMISDNTKEFVAISAAILAATFAKMKGHISLSTGRKTNFSIFCNPVYRNIYQGMCSPSFVFISKLMCDL
jgi:hypothetical protein